MVVFKHTILKRSSKDGRIKLFMNEKKKKLKYGELTLKIFDVLADNLIEVGGYPRGRINVVLGYLIKLVLESLKNRADKTKIKRALKNLEKRQLIHLEDKGGKAIVYVKRKGRLKVIEHSLKKLVEYKKKKKKWDGKWFFIFFDVPEIERRKRNYLRSFLNRIGFHQYQKSVYIFPYECEEEINLIKKVVEGAQYAKYIVAQKIEDEEKFKKIFNLR